MFHRSCPRMGMRFASGNVYYMNQMFSARHLASVASPLGSGFISPAHFSGLTGTGSTQWLPTMQTGSEVVPCETSQLLDGAATSLTDVMPPVALMELLASLHLGMNLKIASVCCDELRVRSTTETTSNTSATSV
jgi:hypothetical protein